jgi:CPA2 family monovalent cation:H+ antiporter-2
MATQFNVAAYSDALVVLGTAGIVVPMVRRWGISPVFGYLAAGAVLGPLGLGSFMDAAPWLYWITVVDAKNVAGIAELGVVFLMFLIGLELSYQRLITMRRLVFGLGSLQVALSTAVIAGIIALVGNEPAAVSIILGACLALSSTAIVIELLAVQGRLATVAGRASFSVLLAQDLAVVPILLFASILGAGIDGSALTGLVLAVTNAALALGIIVIVGRLFLRPLFRLVASTDAHELFVAATRNCQHSHDGWSGRAFFGAWRLRSWIAVGRDGIRKGHSGNHRTIQGTAAWPLLFHDRHEHRFP